MENEDHKPPILDADGQMRSESAGDKSSETRDGHSFGTNGDAAQDDIVAALTSINPADLNIEHMLDHLTTSNDLFASPHLDLSAFANFDAGNDQG
jgi:hypothetical protein